MKRDCNNCPFFFKGDPIESEGHCDKRKDWVDPAEARECSEYIEKSEYYKNKKMKNSLYGMTMKELEYCIHSLKIVSANTDESINELSIRISTIEQSLSEVIDRVNEIQDFLKILATSAHTCSNFCGNCAHYTPPKSSVSLSICDLSGEIVDPDDSSCVMYHDTDSMTSEVRRILADTISEEPF